MTKGYGDRTSSFNQEIKEMVLDPYSEMSHVYRKNYEEFKPYKRTQKIVDKRYMHSGSPTLDSIDKFEVPMEEKKKQTAFLNFVKSGLNY